MAVDLGMAIRISDSNAIYIDSLAICLKKKKKKKKEEEEEEEDEEEIFIDIVSQILNI